MDWGYGNPDWPPRPRKSTITEYAIAFVLGVSILALIIAAAIGAVTLFS